MSFELIPFFDQNIKIVPHTASDYERLDKPVSIADFAGERCVRLYKKDNGELLCQVVVRPYQQVDEFIEGPEAV